MFDLLRRRRVAIQLGLFPYFLTKLLVRAGMFEVGMVKKEILSRLLSRGKHAYPRHLYVQKKPLMGE